jgi:hypothetical protein
VQRPKQLLVSNRWRGASIANVIYYLHMKLKVRMTPQLRKFWAGKTFDMAVVGAGAMLFGQFLTDRPFSPWLAIGGLGMIVLGYLAGFWAYQGGEKTK